MAQVSYPGVYIKEVPSGVRTVTSVSTSIAAFLGRATKGPIDKAVRLLSLADYERAFGKPHPRSDLAQSVRHFFTNGGTDCYVVRLAPNAEAATTTLSSLAEAPALVASAKMMGDWANTLRLTVDYNTLNPNDTFNLRLQLEEGGDVVGSEEFTGLTMDPDSPRFAPAFVTSSSEWLRLELDSTMATSIGDIENSFEGYSQSRRTLEDDNEIKGELDALINPGPDSQGRSRFEISVDGSDFVEVDLGPWSSEQITGADISTSDIAERFRDRIDAALATVGGNLSVTVVFQSPTTDLPNLLTITSSHADSSRASVRIRSARERDIAQALMLGVRQGGIEPTRWSHFRPAPNGSLLPIGNPQSAGDASVLNSLAALSGADITSIEIDGERTLLDAAPHNLEDSGDPWHVDSGGGHDGVREKLNMMAAAITNNPLVNCRAEVWGYQLAILPTGGTINEQPTTIATGAADFDDPIVSNTRRYTLGTGSTSSFVTNANPGDNGQAPTAASYLGNGNDQTGFHALDPVDLFNLMIIPGDEDVADDVLLDLWGPASNYCASNRAFLLIDPPAAWVRSDGRPAVVQDTSKIDDLRRSLVADHAAVFYPRLTYREAGVTRRIGPAGAIAGLMARTDASRGVWKAPAGIEAGVRGINGLEVELTDAENGVLNKKGVNCIRVLPNGIVNWGARTLDGDDDFGSEWKYVPIRRLALMIQESLYRGTRWAVFEPNDEPLWANIRLNLKAYMMSLYRRGAFQGSDPADAFYVKCDRETTTQNDRNKGIVNIEVGFAPVKPAEFVVIRIQQMSGDL